MTDSLETARQWPRLLEYSVRGAPVIPWGAILALYGLVLHARLYLGRWPYPYRPDPKTLPFFSYYGWVFSTLSTWSMFVFIPWIAVFIMRLGFRRPLGLVSPRIHSNHMVTTFPGDRRYRNSVSNHIVTKTAGKEGTRRKRKERL